jgi:hypothetical protein
MGSSCHSTPRAETGNSLQVRNRKGRSKKADAQVPAQLFFVMQTAEMSGQITASAILSVLPREAVIQTCAIGSYEVLK